MTDAPALASHQCRAESRAPPEGPAERHPSVAGALHPRGFVRRARPLRADARENYPMFA